MAREIEIYVTIAENEQIKQGSSMKKTNFSSRLRAEIAQLREDVENAKI